MISAPRRTFHVLEPEYFVPMVTESLSEAIYVIDNERSLEAEHRLACRPQLASRLRLLQYQSAHQTLKDFVAVADINQQLLKFPMIEVTSGRWVDDKKEQPALVRRLFQDAPELSLRNFGEEHGLKLRGSSCDSWDQ